MHTEHLQNVRAARVLAGWGVAIAVTSLVSLAAIGFGFIENPAVANPLWNVIAVTIGFFAGGFFAGFRAIEAPILHAVAIGLTSLVVWVAVNLISTLLFPDFLWQGLTPTLTLAILVVQMAAAMIGALLGYNFAREGKAGLGEHEPLPEE